VPLVKPSGLINLTDVNTVRFTAKIQKQERRITLDSVTIQVANLDPGLTFSEVLPAGKLTLLPRQGQDPATATDARLEADFKDVLKPGQYSIPLTPLPPEGFDVEAYEPLVITVRVRTAPVPASNSSGGAGLQGQNQSQGSTSQPSAP